MVLWALALSLGPLHRRVPMRKAARDVVDGGCAVCELFRLIAFLFSQHCSPMIKVGEWSMPPYPAKLFYTWPDEIRIDAVNRRVARLMPRVFVRFIIQLVRKGKRMVNAIDTMLFRSCGTFINGDAYRRGTAPLFGCIGMSEH